MDLSGSALDAAGAAIWVVDPDGRIVLWNQAAAALTGISGSTTIGKRCQIAGEVAIGGHLTICDDVVFLGTTMVSHSITEPGVYSSGIPLEKATTWRRMVARFKRIDRLDARLKKLEGAAPGTGAAGDPPNDQEEDLERTTD